MTRLATSEVERWTATGRRLAASAGRTRPEDAFHLKPTTHFPLEPQLILNCGRSHRRGYGRERPPYFVVTGVTAAFAAAAALGAFDAGSPGFGAGAFASSALIAVSRTTLISGEFCGISILVSNFVSVAM